jgi:hypothetical protein
MNLINSESPVFTNISINLAFQILSDIQIVLHCVHLSFAIKQTTPLKHIPLTHDTFFRHFDMLAMDFGRANAFHIK